MKKVENRWFTVLLQTSVNSPTISHGVIQRDLAIPQAISWTPTPMLPCWLRGQGRGGWYPGGLGKKNTHSRGWERTPVRVISAKVWGPGVRSLPGYSPQCEKQLLQLTSFSLIKRIQSIPARFLWAMEAAVIQMPGNTEGCLLCAAQNRKKPCSRSRLWYKSPDANLLTTQCWGVRD